MGKFSIEAFSWLYGRYWVVGIFLLIPTVFSVIQLRHFEKNPTPYILDRDHSSRKSEHDLRKYFTNTGEHVLIVSLPSSSDIGSGSYRLLTESLIQEFHGLSLINSNEYKKLISNNNELFSQFSDIDNDNKSNFSIYSELLSFRYQNKSKISKEDQNSIEKALYYLKPIRNVRGITNTEIISSDGEDLEITNLASNSDANINGILKDYPILRGLIVSNDLKAGAITIELSIPEYDSKAIKEISEKIDEILERKSADIQIYQAGSPLVLTEISNSMEKDNARYFPLVLLVILVTLAIIFRYISCVFFPILIAIFSVIWTLGIMSFLGVKQNIITTIIPVFAITIAVADAIHYLSVYLTHRSESDSKSATVKTIKQVLAPIFATTITTIVGFLTMLSSEFQFVREFAVFMSIAVGFAFVASLIVLPGFSPLIARSGAKSYLSSKIHLLIHHFAINITWIASKYKREIFLALSVLFVSTLLINQKLRIDIENTDSFGEKSDLYVGVKKINSVLGGSTSNSLLLRSGNQEGFYSSEALKHVENIQNYIQSLDEISYTISYVDFIKQIHKVIDEPNQYEIPENIEDNYIRQLLLLYENSRATEIGDLLDSDGENTRIFMLANTDVGSDWLNIQNKIYDFARSELSNDYSIAFSGYGNVMASVVTEVIRSQLLGLILGCVAILLLMIFWFKSVSLGIIGILPLIFTQSLTFAFLFVGLNHSVTVGTAIVSAIIFGVGVDYSIHYISHYRRLKKDSDTSETEIHKEVSLKVGKAIVVNSLALSLGFIVLSLSSYAPMSLLGIHLSFTMFISAISALLILPATLTLIYGKNKHITKNQQTISELSREHGH